MSLTEALRAAIATLGIGVDDGYTPSQSTYTPPTLEDIEVGHVKYFIGREEDPSELYQTQRRLSELSSQAFDKGQIIRTAKIINANLEDINDIIANNQGRGFPFETTYGAINRIQAEVSNTRDGVFGPQTAKDLVSFLTDNVDSDIQEVQDINLDGLYSLQSFLATNASGDYQSLLRLQELVAEKESLNKERIDSHLYTIRRTSDEIDALNQAIVDAFQQCSEHTVDLDGQNPFEGIVQDITEQYAQTADEIDIAEEHVATAIKDNCAFMLHDIREDSLEEAIASVAEKLQAPLEEEVLANIQDARDAADNNLRRVGGFRQAIGLDPALNHK